MEVGSRFANECSNQDAEKEATCRHFDVALRQVSSRHSSLISLPEDKTMPVHDWTRVDANLFHDFHQTWTIAIRNALNGGLLPKGFSALVEQHAAGLVPDVIALQRRPRTSGPAEPTGGVVVTATLPKTRHILRAE